ncbi:MAG TPA: hypothetical protein PKK40_10270, partial [Marmoricola sp.]|nr:hypothetical protein [Marmoricola sp.]
MTSASTAASPSDRKQLAVGGDLGVAATSAASVVFVSPSATPVAASSVSRAALARSVPSAGLLSRRRMASLRAAVSPTGISKPVTPSSMASSM